MTMKYIITTLFTTTITIELQSVGNASLPIIAILLYLVFDKGRTLFSFFNNTLL
jgi:hypothetical protein